MGILDDLKPQTKKQSPRAVGVQGEALAVDWADGRQSRFLMKLLRERCPCAGCVDEWSGTRTLDPAKIPADIKPISITEVGRYAMQIGWSDGHTTGIYSWELLAKLHDELAASRQRRDAEPPSPGTPS